MSLPFPATLVFDNETEIQLYSKWQIQQPSIPGERHGALPDAFQYADYVYWRDNLRSLYLPELPELPGTRTSAPYGPREALDPKHRARLQDEGWMFAQKCGHALHPAHPVHAAAAHSDDKEEGQLPETVQRCPVCVVRALLDFVNVLLQKWKDVGGPWRNIDQAADPEAMKYRTAQRAYHHVKVDLLNTVHEFEEWAVAEAEWEEENPDVEVELASWYGATAALDLFRDELESSQTASPGTLEKERASLSASPEEEQAQPQRKKAKKRIIFSEDTAETRNRDNSLFYRSSTTYDQQSPHTCPDGEGWVDTSFYQDVMYTISQCRILLLIYDHSANPKCSYVDLNDGKHRGSNKHVERLQKLVGNWLTAMPPDLHQYWAARMSAFSDIFMVYKEIGVLVRTLTAFVLPRRSRIR
jgi:hypothetical protein